MAPNSPRLTCTVEGCTAYILETIHPGVYVCLAVCHKETPVYEVKDGMIVKRTTGHVINLGGS